MLIYLKKIKEIIENSLLYSEDSIIKHFGITTIKGILLYGPPGCGKTSIIRNIQKKYFSKCNFYTILGPEIIHAELGISEQKVIFSFKNLIIISFS